ncbi:MAG: PKD domain-containing protein [Candidatus Bathyarchaeia archaeon]
MNSKRKSPLLLMGIIGSMIVYAVFVPAVNAAPCAILQVSLLGSVYHGYDVDPWLCQSYLLNLTGASQTFTVRISNPSASLRSYDTRLVIALNDAGYNKLVSLIVNGITVPKSAFKSGTPKPYKLWTWPSGDVYPTWFNDTVINVGLISKKSYKDLVVSVTFSDANGVRMHFDAYGSSVPGYPPSSGYITHNPLEQDSTVLFNVGPPPPQPPVAIFTFSPLYPEVNQAVTFDASGSCDPDGYIVSYTWNFGDGTPPVVENDPIAYHTYTSFGDYTVKLTVTDNSGLTDDETAQVHVSQHPVASFTFSPQDPAVHEIVTFDASASSPDGGTLVSYTWNFGDGNVTSTSNPIITHAYNTHGTYTVTLNVTDSEGKWDTVSHEITVEKAPIAEFWWTPYYPQRGETVTFDASASTPDGGVIISYAWDFGDGTPIIEENDPEITHVYTTAGEYTVTLNVTDSEGRWDTATHTITVVLRLYYLTVKTAPEGVTTIPGENWYNEGTEVTLTAPDTVPVSTGIRYKFSYWDVDGTPKTGNSINVLMDANHTATAHYSLEYYLTVTSPFGTVGGEGWYPSGTTAYATLNTGIVDHGNGTRRVFTNWNGDATGTNYAQSNPITMNGPKTAVANWKTQYAVTFTQTGSAVAPTVTYTADTDPTETVPFTVWVLAGSQITYTYQESVLGAPGVRYILTGTTPSSPQTVNGPLTVSGSYQVQYYLTVSTDPLGITTIPGEGWYNPSQNVQLSAPSVSGYTFQYWDVDGASQGTGTNPITVTMNAPHTATAHYTQIVTVTYTLKIEATSGGTTTPTPGTYTHTAGSIVQVTANPSYGYVFDHWELNGTNVGSSSTYTVTMNNNYILKAFFQTAPTPPTVSISPMSSSIVVGQNVKFTSTVSGGVSPYTYQWYLNGTPVNGATSSSWTFNPTASGEYLVYLKVIDNGGNAAQSGIATITVLASAPMPVGGHSFSVTPKMATPQLTIYMALLVLLSCTITLAKRKRNS